MSKFTAGESYSIEHMGWAERRSFLAYGRRIGVRVNDPEVLGLLRKHLPYGSKPSQVKNVSRLYSLFTSGRQSNSKLRTPHLLFRGAVCLARSLRLDEVFEALEQDARLYVAEHARRRIFVHAAVVGWNGRAIVIPGKSMSGKTSLAAEFVRAGASYYSDEYAVFDEAGRVHPYAKPLSIRKPGDRTYRQTDYPVETFGGRAGSRPLEVGLVLITRYRAGARWLPRRVSPGMGAMALLANAVPARNQPEQTLEVLSNVMRSASALKSLRGEACGIVNCVLASQNSQTVFELQLGA